MDDGRAKGFGVARHCSEKIVEEPSTALTNDVGLPSDHLVFPDARRIPFSLVLCNPLDPVRDCRARTHVNALRADELRSGRLIAVERDRGAYIVNANVSRATRATRTKVGPVGAHPSEIVEGCTTRTLAGSLLDGRTHSTRSEARTVLVGVLALIDPRKRDQFILGDRAGNTGVLFNIWPGPSLGSTGNGVADGLDHAGPKLSDRAQDVHDGPADQRGFRAETTALLGRPNVAL